MASNKPGSLATVRKAAGFSQQQLAQTIGAHWITISKLERGKMRMTYEWASKIAEALDVKINDIFWMNISDTEEDIKLAGCLEDRGVIRSFSDDEGRVVRFGVDNIIRSDSVFYISETDDLAPVVQKTDLIRLTSIDQKHARMFIGRACLGKIDEKLTLGILYSGDKTGNWELRSSNGTLLLEGAIRIIACVSMIICAWSALNQVHYRDFSGEGGIA